MDIYGNPVEGENLSNGGTIDGNLDVNGNVVIDGDLTVNGTITSVDQIEVKDAIITVAVDNPADLVNSGISMARNNNSQFSGLIRASSDGRFKIVGSMPTIEPGSVLVPNGSLDLVDVGLSSGMFWDQGHEIKNVAGNLEIVSSAEMKIDSQFGDMTIQSADRTGVAGNTLDLVGFDTSQLLGVNGATIKATSGDITLDASGDVISTADITLPTNGDLKWASGNHFFRELGTSMQIFSTGNILMNPTGALILSSSASIALSSDFCSIKGSVQTNIADVGTGITTINGSTSRLRATNDVDISAGTILAMGGQSVQCSSTSFNRVDGASSVELNSSAGFISLDSATGVVVNQGVNSYTLPTVRGAATQVLTDVLGDGNLSWANTSVTGNYVEKDDPLEQTMIGPLRLENAGVKQNVTCGNAVVEQLTVSGLVVPLLTGVVDIGSGFGARFRDLYITSANVSGTMTLNSSGSSSYTFPSVRGSAGQVLTDVSGNGVLSWQDDDSGGDVQGPAGATDNGLALFDGTTGKLLKDSAATLSSDAELGLIGNSARVNLDNFGSEWSLRNQGFFELYRRDSPTIGGGNPEVILNTQSSRLNIFRPTWVQNSLTVNAGVDSYELPTTRPVAGQVLTATSTTTSAWANVATNPQIFTLAFGGNAGTQAQRFLLFNGSSNVASTAGIDIQSVQYMIKDTYLVGASFIRENTSSNTTFAISVETSPGSGILVDQNLFTMTAA
jgi:hypothetical protein